MLLEAFPKKRALLWSEQPDKLGNDGIQNQAFPDYGGHRVRVHGFPFLVGRFAGAGIALCGFGGVLSMRRSTSSSFGRLGVMGFGIVRSPMSANEELSVVLSGAEGTMRVKEIADELARFLAQSAKYQPRARVSQRRVRETQSPIEVAQDPELSV